MEESDVRKLMQVISTSCVILQSERNHQLINFITKDCVPPEVTHDLLNARTIGQADYEASVKYHFLKDPSVQLPKRKRKLLTLKNPTRKGKKKSKAEEEKQLITFCTKKAIAWANQHEQGIECIGKQFIEQPRALVNPDGKPTKGNKHTMTATLCKRYSSILKSDLHVPSWTPEIAILDGMFFINVKPLGKTFQNYSTFLLRRFVEPFYAQGTNEVHILFDREYNGDFNPKQWEQNQRDNAVNVNEHDRHQHVSTISDSTQVPLNWRGLLGCRKCKHGLIVYLSNSMLHHAPKHIKNQQQKLITSGPAEPRSCNLSGNIIVEHKYECQAIEADSRLWRHSAQCGYHRQLIYCPDTDGYIVGLTNHNHTLDIVVELTTIGSKERKLLLLSNLIDNLERDPDLSLLPNEDLPVMLQALYVSTGCDYISSFSGIGKSSFFSAFCRYSDFITGPRMTGSLGNWKSPDAYLAFLRLVGTTYFIKYRSTYRGTKSPVTLFNSCTGTNTQQHSQWLEKICAHVWEEVHNELNLPPSKTALKLQWLRAVWVIDMWNQANSKTTTTLPPTEYG